MDLKKVLPIFLIFSLLITSGVAFGALVILKPGVVLHPSESHTYYIVNNVIGSTTPVVVDSRYIVISGIPFEVDSNGPVNVYINAWNPEDINQSGAVLFNFTVSTLYHNQTVTFNIGNLPDVPLLIYRDDKPYILSYANSKHTFVGNKTFINENCLSFSDGLNIRKKIHNAITNITNVIHNATHIHHHIVPHITNHNTVITTGTLINVTHLPNGSTVVVIHFGGKYIHILIPGEYPNFPPGYRVPIEGKVVKNKTGPNILVRSIYFNNPVGYSTHTYVIKTIMPASLPATSQQFVGSAPSPPSVKYVGYAVIFAAVIPVGIGAYVVYRRYRGH